jgi:hypothetical protein
MTLSDYFPLYVFIFVTILAGLVLYNWGCGIRYNGQLEEERKNDNNA